jgi:hypothetical protein
MRSIFKQREECSKILYQITRSRMFKQAQIQRFPGDNRVILSSTERAIAAALVDDASAMAEFMISHAKAISEIKQDSPFGVLRNNISLEIAWNRADLYDEEIRSLWYLLLAWELKDQGNFEGSRITLRRLSEKGLVEISSFQWIVQMIMPELVMVDTKTLLSICQSLIGETNMLWTAVSITKSQAEAGDFDAAFKVAESIGDDKVEENIEYHYRSEALITIAGSQVNVDKDGAKRTLDAAVQSAKNIEDASAKIQALITIAGSQVNVDKDGAKRTLDAAVQSAKNIEDASAKIQALITIAGSQVNVDKDDAKRTLDAAVQSAKNIEDNSGRSQSLAKIAELQAKAGDFDAALDTSKAIIVARQSYLYYIITAMIRAGDKDHFKEILISSAQDLYTAYRMIGLLFDVYKHQSRELSTTLHRLTL